MVVCRKNKDELVNSYYGFGANGITYELVKYHCQ